MFPGTTRNNILSNPTYSIQKNSNSIFVSSKFFNKYSKNNNSHNKSLCISDKSLKPYKVVNNTKLKLGHSVLLKKSKYKWENENGRVVATPTMLQDSTHWYNKTPNKFTLLSASQNNIKEDNKIHYRPSIPFNSVISKGWFSKNVCDLRCVVDVPFDLQSCCFIREQFIPENTLNISKLMKEVNKDFHKAEKTDVENNSFVALSKHKLIRKQVHSVPKTLELKTDFPVMLNTRRKLIRKSKLNTNERNISISSAELQIPDLTDAKQNSTVFSELINKKKHVFPSTHLQQNSSFIVLTDRKLVRKPKMSIMSDSSGIRRKINKSVTFESPEKLISLNRNKLVRLSLLRKNSRSSKVAGFCHTNSVLYQMIQYRRKPYHSSSYALLTRNKLIKRMKFKQRVIEPFTKEIKPLKTVVSTPKTFVSVGSNKLIRKSLFSKSNKTDAQRKTSQILSHVPKLKLNHVLNSPSKRIQLFTNHLSRMKLKYVSEGVNRIIRNKFKNRCKNNKRILRWKKTEIVCPVFRKQGRCLKHSKKCCPMLHDKKFVSVCKNQLKGHCEDLNCHLSHQLIPQKVPICLHYLKDSCSIEDCVYLHVRPDLNASICVQFLRGYCESGDKCPNWHLYACQEYKDSSICKKGDKCHLPHRSIDYFERKVHDVNEDEENSMNWRYFENKRLSENDEASVSVIPQRQPMGILPDFIPL